jgi:hypothetical protein
MSRTVRLTDSLANELTTECESTNIDFNEFVNHLVLLGLRVQKDLPTGNIANDKNYNIDDDGLDDLANGMWANSEASISHFEARKVKGLGVGLDDNDKLVYQRDLNS